MEVNIPIIYVSSSDGSAEKLGQVTSPPPPRIFSFRCLGAACARPLLASATGLRDSLLVGARQELPVTILVQS